MKDTSPPAFPVQLPCSSTGMTLRDWFAGQALVGLGTLAADIERGELTHQMLSQWASRAYEMADYMLMKREKKNYD